MLSLLLSEKEAFLRPYHTAANISRDDYIIGGYDNGSHKNTFIRNVK